ncbi:SDR family oxidoreductase [Pseudofrankia inefficax]|uniref:dTDP-4-dehydrorhamnose reductase n=1 Tax=Pseudofrankia inefficax (strain DSM 45817 / CECT 9037 / DDB 130130 / EuI1c) TaxID=298654 RepID=E3J3D6_PSEI1|nr:SDR family oxidoreductase [Pseudofrankia inefficax]ADP78138.1 dTDP-4-dehydrorhamnose reductase [Pseudofrankia inefficax]
MRVLVLGGAGMLGHELASALAGRHDVGVTVHGPRPPRRRDRSDPWAGALPANRIFAGLDVRCQDDLAGLLADFRPEAVVNAVGLVKQRPEGRTALPAVEINTVFPHRLARLCRIAGVRMVHVSSDCVFSGRRGRYTEDDQPDPVDVYGMSKLLGEIREAPVVTLRTSIIGLEPAGRGSGLVEWFLAQTGQVSGYRRAIYTGLTTMEFARVVDRLLTKHEDLTGLWHVATAEAITKHELLTRLADRLRRAGGSRAVAEVVAAEGPACDRSLLADRFAEATGYTAPGWDAMLDELVERITLRDDGGRRDG